MVVQKRTVKCPSETAQSLRDNLIIVYKYLQGKNTEHWTNGWKLQTDKLKLKWGTIFLKVRLINHWNKGSAWILIVLQSSNHSWMSFLKVKHNLWDSERSNRQNPNDLLNRVCQNNYRICSFLLFNSIMWSPIFYWKLLSHGLISEPHLSKSPSHQTRNQGIQEHSTCVLLWKWHHISFSLIILVDIRIPFVLWDFSYIPSRMSISDA